MTYKPRHGKTFCICENKGAEQPPGNRTADQRIYFRYVNSTSLNPNFQASSHFLWLYSPFCVGNPEDKFCRDAVNMRHGLGTWSLDDVAPELDAYNFVCRHEKKYFIRACSEEWVLIKLRECTGWAVILNEPRSEKTGLRGFRPGPTRTGLYSHRRWLEA